MVLVHGQAWVEGVRAQRVEGDVDASGEALTVGLCAGHQR
jgi:hypothetical protein